VHNPGSNSISSLMTSEPKSIFTSKRDFEKDFGSLPERKSPNNNIAPTVLPPSAVDDSIVRAAAPHVSTVEASTYVRTSSGTAAAAESRSRENSVSSSQTRPFFNASQPAQVSISTALTIEPTFRKPDLPLPNTANSTSTNASKHPREEHGNRPASTERPSKRTRPKLRPRHTLDAESFHAATVFPKKGVGSPPSPLFFSSHKARQRPLLPSSFSSSDAASMMSKARDEPGGVTTLKLARGSISSASPPRSTSTPGSWSERSSVPRSPAARTKSSSGLQILSSVGIIELLDQDERPTFIIDIANSANFTPGPLQIIFANAALCAYESILEMVTGKADLDSPGIAVTNDFPEFKAWALSFVKNGETLDICLPSFVYGGVTWTCSTLRKRLRIISGSSSSIMNTATSTSSNGALSTSSILSERHTKANTRLPRSPLVDSSEPLDYFGDAAPPFVPTASTSPLQNVSSPGLPMVTEDGEAAKQAMLASQGEAITTAMMQARYPDSPSFDWTRLPMSAALPRHIQFARSIDWAATALGPIENWTFDLRAMCNLVMGAPHPAAMYWGEEYIAIYNEAYILLAGQKHPQLMVRDYYSCYLP
jgi:hypothetical protein